jgi:hypothetical protein
VCGHDSWCSVTNDGQICLCRRREEGAFASREDRNGAAYYVHRIEDGRPVDSSLWRCADGDARRAHRIYLNLVYQALLGLLELSPAHRSNLRERGLDDDDIDAREYRTLPAEGRPRLTARVAERLEEWSQPKHPVRHWWSQPLKWPLSESCRATDLLPSVPGFVEKDGIKGKYLTIAAPPEDVLLIPVCNESSLIVALKARCRGEPKYLYLTSTKYNGPGPGSPLHFPPCWEVFRKALQDREIRLTEGELKADVLTRLTGIYTLGLPGVSNWRLGVDYAKELAVAGRGPLKVRLAWDSDCRAKREVARTLRECADALRAEGIQRILEDW